MWWRNQAWEMCPSVSRARGAPRAGSAPVARRWAR
jgi:hypothetical protein